MRKDCISVAFVGVFAENLSFIPALDPNFCKNLFDEPSRTICGMTPEGYVITIDKRQMPLVVISQNKICIRAKDEETVVKLCQIMSTKISEIGLKTIYSAIGLNYEYQWLELNESAENWICKRFVKRDVFETIKLNSCQKLSLRTEISNDEFANLDIEPRVGTNDGVFVGINHHHNIRMERIPVYEELVKMYASSKKKIEKILLELIEK